MFQGTLILEGGATRGVFTAGALDCLMQQNIELSDVIGVSAGACNAVDYVSKQIGRTKNCMIPTDKALSYYSDIKTFMRARSIMNMDLIFDTYPKEIFPFDFETYFSSAVRNEIVITNCRSGKAEYVVVNEGNERLLKTVRASCSLPLMTPMVNLDDVPYVDGGVGDAVPLLRALERGDKKIVVVLTRNRGYRKRPPSRGVDAVYRRAYKSFPRLLRTIRHRHRKYNQVMELADRLNAQGRIFVLRPTDKTISRLERNKETLEMFYHHGHDRMTQELPRLLEYLQK